MIKKSFPSKLILATQSARRRSVLHEMGWQFESTVAKGIVEYTAKEIHDVEKLVLMNARLKATAPALLEQYNNIIEDTLLVGIDTVVHCDNVIFEKPKSHGEAEEMFDAYLKHPAEVHTGLALYCGHTGECYEAHDRTIIHARKDLFRQGEDQRKFLNLAMNLEASGGFSIEGLGAAIFDRIDGSFYTVVGMPVHLLIRLLQEAHVPWESFIATSPR